MVCYGKLQKLLDDVGKGFMGQDFEGGKYILLYILDDEVRKMEGRFFRG